MSQIENLPKPESNSTHLTKRGRIVKFMTTLGLGAAVGIGAEHGLDSLAHDTASSVHQVDESGHYSQRDLFNKMQENGGFDSAKVEVRSVAPGDTPELMATKMGARDIRLVGSEISAQEGGEDHLQVGDQVVVPRDQLDSEGK